MLNTDHFIKNLETILDYYQLSASAFADKIGVQRSSLSHLLSGRNKPSLDFVLKIIDVFPEVDFYWFMKNEGTFPKSNTPISNIPKVENVIPKNLFDTNVQMQEDLPLHDETSTNISSTEVLQETLAFSENLNPTSETSSIPKSDQVKSDIDHVMIFYKNGKFKIYHQE